ncbi:MAG TPA: sulfotransferase [Fimbriimonadaceae bacterium]
MIATQIQSLLEVANAAFMAKDWAKEESVLRRIVEIDFSISIAQLRLAQILSESDRQAEAIVNLDRLMKLGATDPQVEFQLAALLSDQGRHNESIPHLLNLTKRYPQDLGVLAYLAQTYQEARRPAEAVPFLDRALQIRPDEPDFLFARAQCLQELRRVMAAEADLRVALAKSPNPGGFMMLANINMQSNRYREAHENASRALALDTNLLMARVVSAKALMSVGELELAEKEWSAATLIASDKAGLLREKGTEYCSQGMFEEAGEAFKRSIEEDPNSGESYYLLVAGRRCGADDLGLVSQMQDLLAGGKLSKEQEQKVCYAIGKVWDDVGQYREALASFDQANRIGLSLFTGHSLSKESIEVSTNAIISRYTAEFIASYAGQGNPSPLPIFVVGMMRSGTTLVEQLLSAHPLIGGAGEQPFWMEYENEFSGLLGKPFNMERLLNLSENYLNILTDVAPDSARVVDKNNCNSYLAGMLAIAFPNSKSIHVQRDPVDTALSIWTTVLYDKSSFLCDRSNVVTLLKDHFRLARHWAQVIPRRQYTELKYESLVDDTESEMHRVVSFLGLKWNSACSRPEANQRTIRTPSYWQTRQPIYKRSSQRWKNYEPWLGEFADLVAEQKGDSFG